MNEPWPSIISGVFALAGAIIAAYITVRLGPKPSETFENIPRLPDGFWLPDSPRPNPPVQGVPIKVSSIYRRGTFLGLIVTVLGGVAGWALITGIFYLTDPSYDPIHEATSILLPIVFYIIAARFISLRILLSTKYIVLWLVIGIAAIPVSVYVSSLFPSEPVVLAVVSFVSNFLSAFWIYGIIGRMMIRFSNRKRNVLVSTGF